MSCRPYTRTAGIPRSLGSRPASTCPSIKKQPRLQKMGDHLGKHHPEPGNLIAWIRSPAGHQRHVRALPHTPFLRPPLTHSRIGIGQQPAVARSEASAKAQCAPQPGQGIATTGSVTTRQRLPNLRSRLRTGAVNTDWVHEADSTMGAENASVARPNLPPDRVGQSGAAINDAAISRRGDSGPPRTASP